jgi:hypothetical protein
MWTWKKLALAVGAAMLERTRAIAPSAAVCAAALVLVHVSPASATELQAGLWKITTTRDAAGKKLESSQSRCLTAEHVAHLDRAFAAGAAPLTARCRTLRSSWSGNTLAWRVRCGHRLGVTATATYAFDRPDHFTAVLKTLSMTPPAATIITITSVGQRVGECTK